MQALSLINMFFTIFVRFKEIGVRILIKKFVKIMVEFFMKFCVASGTEKASVFEFSWKSITNKVNVMKLNNPDW